MKELNAKVIMLQIPCLECKDVHDKFMYSHMRWRIHIIRLIKSELRIRADMLTSYNRPNTCFILVTRLLSHTFTHRTKVISSLHAIAIAKK